MDKPATNPMNKPEPWASPMGESAFRVSLDLIGSADDAAEVLGVSRARVGQLVRGGKLTVKRVGRVDVFWLPQVRALADERAAQNATIVTLGDKR